jgi:hypothetical protein
MNKYFFLGIQIVRELHIVIGCSHTKNDFFLHRDQKSKMSTATVFASDKVYQLLAHGLWFFPGTLASSTTKNGRHDIAEILLKVAFLGRLLV